MKMSEGLAGQKTEERLKMVIDASEWINSEPVRLNGPDTSLNLIVVFQMLCPACVIHSIPQVKKAQLIFSEVGVQFIGLHSVFEHHHAMTSEHLRVFLHEFRVDFPVAVDARNGDSRVPMTMERYQFRGTPTTLIVSRSGEILQHYFGVQGDMEFAANIQKYL